MHQVVVPKEGGWLGDGWELDRGMFYLVPADADGLVVLFLKQSGERKRRASAGFDVPGQKVLWRAEHERIRGYRSLYGCLWFSRDRAFDNRLCAVDPLTGEITPTSLKAGHLRVDGGMLWSSSQSFYEMSPPDAAAEAIDVDLRDPALRCSVEQLADSLTGPTHPMEVKKRRYFEAVAAARETGRFEELYATMCEVFEVTAVHPAARTYIESTIDTEKVDGPLYLEGFATSYKGIGSYYSHFSDQGSPRDRYFPGIKIAGARLGQEFTLCFESGAVIGQDPEMQLETIDGLRKRHGGDVVAAVESYVRTYGTISYDLFADFLRICRERYGVASPKELTAKMTGSDYVAALQESCGDPLGRDARFDLVLHLTFEAFSDAFDEGRLPRWPRRRAGRRGSGSARGPCDPMPRPSTR